ncbi:hypothetical protein C0966_05110 [Bacillus methanolicus]|uniref:hypothetical protein n=1 Tax=Bacillus methanolicus TaxID=1471 RepID=UPI0023806147|nr:hypothetical protein [Bacillus methanolicus]MDE3838759.1 hypothetical protein [Bacillus methanolicus]
MKNIKTINLGLQNFAISKKFPSFRLFKDSHQNIYWIGKLQPSEKSPIYTVKIQYDPYQPKVFVLEPEILRSAPLRYGDNSLCLYHPNDNSYRPDMLISDTLIPWASEWLYFYNIWLEEGVWWGKEAPHSPISFTERK